MLHMFDSMSGFFCHVETCWSKVAFEQDLLQEELFCLQKERCLFVAAKEFYSDRTLFGLCCAAVCLPRGCLLNC